MLAFSALGLGMSATPLLHLFLIVCNDALYFVCVGIKALSPNSAETIASLNQQKISNKSKQVTCTASFMA